MTIVVGKSVTKIDAYEKATGGKGFVINISFPDMLYCKILHSPVAHAHIKRIDTSRAEKLEGVKAILTYQNVPHVVFNPTGDFPALETGEEIFVKDTSLFDRTVRFVGDRVAAVAATSEDLAEEALDRIDVDYEILPAVFDPERALKKSVPKIHDDRSDNVAGRLRMGHGDLEKGFKEADAVFEDTYKTPRAQAVPLEPHVCVCKPEAYGSIRVWSSTQSIFVLRSRIGEALGIPKNQVIVEKPPYIGGGFGTKVELHAEAICALLALRTGHPVKNEYSREEDFLSTSRHPTTIRLKTGIKRDGTIIARYASALFDCGAYARHTHVNSIVGHTFVGSYKAPNVLYEGTCVYTNNPPSGSYRGFGGPQPVFAIESQIDQIAEELRIDPLKLRMKNMFQAGDPNPWTTEGLPISSYGLRECIEQGAARIGWDNRNRTAKPSGLVRRGIGAACLPTWVSGTVGIPYIPEFGGAIVRIKPDGVVELVIGVVDIGGGQTTTMAQIAAEELGVPYESVTVLQSNTADSPGDTATHASRVSYVVGTATKTAAAKAKDELLKVASELLGVPVETLKSENGRVSVKTDSSKFLSYGEVVSKHGSPIVGEVHRLKPPNNPVPCAAHFAEVEVDSATGIVRVLRYVAAHDVGRAINPVNVEGQIEGGVQLGLEFALVSELVVDPVTGKPLNLDLLDYKVFVTKDMPKVETVIVETNDPTGPFGAKGIGEPPLIPVAPAIANAIYDATGVRIKQLPLTPERVLQAMAAKH